MAERLMKFLRTGIIVFIMSLVVIPSIDVLANGQPNDAVLESRNGVVKVTFYLKDANYSAYDGKNYYKLQDIGETSFSSGTGFFIGESGSNPEFLVTNEHVVDEYVTSMDKGGTFVFNTGDVYEENGSQYPVVVVAPSCELRIYYSDNEYDVAIVDTPGDVEREDLALLRLKDGATDKRKPLTLKLLSGEVSTTPVWALGFPGLLENSFTSSSKYEVGDITSEPGQITHEPKTDSAGVERYAISSVIRHGNSGGPLVTDDGKVVGVNTNGVSEDGEQSYYAISSKTLSRFLERANAKYEIDETSEETGNDEEAAAEDVSEEVSETVSETISEPESQNTDGTSPASNQSGNSGLIIVFIILGLAVVAIAVVLLLKKKKTPASAIQPSVASSQASAPTPAPAPASDKRAMLRSMSNQHNGMTVAVHAGSQVMIGRDPANCKVVFREGTEGISGRHCSVSYDSASGDFILTDLRSTYGTFLNNGQKLTPNVPYHLKAGDGFYCGVQANSFRVELG